MIHDLQAYRRKLSRIRREKDIPNTDDDFVRCLMNTLDELVDENKEAKELVDLAYDFFCVLPGRIEPQDWCIRADKLADCKNKRTSKIIKELVEDAGWLGLHVIIEPKEKTPKGGE